MSVRDYIRETDEYQALSAPNRSNSEATGGETATATEAFVPGGARAISLSFDGDAEMALELAKVVLLFLIWMELRGR